MSELVIKTFKESDYPAVIKYCLPEEQAIYTSLPIDVIEEFKKDQYNQPFVVVYEGKLVGCFALYTNKRGNIYTNNENSVIFKSFSIDSRFQRKGFALNVLKLLPTITKQHYPEKNEIILTVHHTNIAAINLYIKAGFKEQESRFEGDYGEELIFHFDLAV
ncbi:GNAT family protein [Viridibacillus arvi]|uniref:GNAT family N-acetyltransferase n=1 Tax=Viridibacillus arvi TaxID=263475 RepID=UPI003D2E7670